MKIIQYMLGIRNADGGVVRAFVDLSTMLAQRGHEVIVLTTDDRDAARDWNGREGRPRLVTLPFSKVVPMLLSRSAMTQSRELFSGAAVVHLHVPWDPICPQLARLARRMRIPCIMTIHGMLDNWTLGDKSTKKRLYLALFGRRMLERAAFVQCTAQVEAEQSLKWFPNGRSCVVPLPFDLKPFEKLPGEHLARAKAPMLNSNGFNVLFVGRLHPIKRAEMLLEAASKLRQRNIRCHVLIAGTGDSAYEQSLHQRARQLGLESHIAFLGFITGAEKLSLYQAVDVAVVPSAHESFGYTAIEALACGTPVVTTRAVNIWPELQSGGGALIVEETTDAFADALTRLHNDRQLRNQMGQRGRDWVFSYLEPTRVIEQYESMYRNTANR
jgi:glycosyltransferase involved in cell wall biosynthesis